MQLKGTSATGQSRKVIKWTLADKVAVYRAVRIDKTSPKDAFAAIATAKNVTLPQSYIDYPHSHVWRFTKEFEKAIAKGNAVVMAALKEAGCVTE